MTSFNCLLTGPKGSGKSWALVQLCRILGGNALIIDAEKSTRPYYEQGGFFYPTFKGHVMDFIPSILEAHAIVKEILANPVLPNGEPCRMLGIDGLSPLWLDIQYQVEEYKHQKRGAHRFETGMSQDAWNVINKYWKRFIADLRRLEMPLICTAWQKDEWDGVGDSRKLVGKTTDCQKNIEYEFDLIFYMSQFMGTPLAMVEKSRYHDRFTQGTPITINLHEAIVSAFPGVFSPDATAPMASPGVEEIQVKRFHELIREFDLSHAHVRGGFHKYGVSRFEDLRQDQGEAFIDAMQIWCEKRAVLESNNQVIPIVQSGITKPHSL